MSNMVRPVNSTLRVPESEEEGTFCWLNSCGVNTIILSLGVFGKGVNTEVCRQQLCETETETI